MGKRRLALPVLASLTLGLLAWTQPAQLPPYRSWVWNWAPGICGTWTVPGAESDRGLPVQTHQCDRDRESGTVPSWMPFQVQTP